jgi:hypothetical protein
VDTLLRWNFIRRPFTPLNCKLLPFPFSGSTPSIPFTSRSTFNSIDFYRPKHHLTIHRNYPPESHNITFPWASHSAGQYEVSCPAGMAEGLEMGSRKLQFGNTILNYSCHYRTNFGSPSTGAVSAGQPQNRAMKYPSKK